MNDKISIEYIDHVALRVKDIEIASTWYHEVLGLKKLNVPEWGEFPVFLLAGKSGIALFPAKIDEPDVSKESMNVKIDHFAFRVDKENFERVKRKYEALGLKYNIQDHHYFQSIYTKDPDGHTVELTTLIVEEGAFYSG